MQYIYTLVFRKPKLISTHNYEVVCMLYESVSFVDRSQYLRVLGYLLKLYRQESRMSQIDIASYLDISRNYIGHIEQGKVNISIYRLHKIITVIGCDFGNFIKHVDQAVIEYSQNRKPLREICKLPFIQHGSQSNQSESS